MSEQLYVVTYRFNTVERDGWRWHAMTLNDEDTFRLRNVGIGRRHPRRWTRITQVLLFRDFRVGFDWLDVTPRCARYMHKYGHSLLRRVFIKETVEEVLERIS